MDKTASGSDITLTIPYTYNQTQLTLTGFSYTVYDASGTVLTGPTADPSFNPANTQSVITIDGVHNVTTAKKDIRRVVCAMTTTAGTFNQTVFYEIEGDVLSLTPLTDSFMTYPDAIMVRGRMAEPMSYYDSLEDEDKVVALEAAYNSLNGLAFTVDGVTINDITSLTVTAFNALNPKFLEALKKAQIAEADVIVENNPIKDKIRMGIVSETIGESSMYFGTGNGAVSNPAGISDQGYKYLSKWLYASQTNAQIWTIRRS